MATELVAAGHIPSSEKTEVDAVAWLADQDPVHGMVSLRFNVALPSPVNLI